MSAIRSGYQQYGVDKYYELNKDSYENPHKHIINNLLTYAKQNWELGNNLLDLCCGSGEVTNSFLDYNIVGCDPYTFELYKRNTNKKCYTKTFKDIAIHGLENYYDTIICSFAMHLCEESMLPTLLYQLSLKAKQLIIITPHKRPNCDGIYGWTYIDNIKENKVNIILYKQLRKEKE